MKQYTLLGFVGRGVAKTGIFLGSTGRDEKSGGYPYGASSLVLFETPSYLEAVMRTIKSPRVS